MEYLGTRCDETGRRCLSARIFLSYRVAVGKAVLRRYYGVLIVRESFGKKKNNRERRGFNSKQLLTPMPITQLQ